MNHTVKLLIPVGLGIFAAVINSMVLSGQTRPAEFVRVSKDLARGEAFRENNLEVLPIPGTLARRLTETAVPWSEVGILYGQRTVRDFVRGDIVFYQDFGVRGAEMNLAPGEAASPISLNGLNISDGALKVGARLMLRLRLTEEGEAQWFGPCRLLAVGDRMSNAVLGTGSGGGAAVSTVWVAVPQTPRAGAETELCDAIQEFTARQMDDNARVLGVRVLDRGSQPTPL